MILRSQWQVLLSFAASQASRQPHRGSCVECKTKCDPIKRRDDDVQVDQDVLSESSDSGVLSGQLVRLEKDGIDFRERSNSIGGNRGAAARSILGQSKRQNGLSGQPWPP